MAHPIENIMKTTMEELREMVDVNTIIGDPVMTGSDTVIVPVSKVSLGFLSGGGEYGKCTHKDEKGGESEAAEARHPFAGTSVAGINLTPMAFIAISGGTIKVLPAHYNCTLDRIIEMVPNSIRELERVIREICANKKSEPGECGHGQDTEHQGKDKYYE